MSRFTLVLIALAACHTTPVRDLEHPTPQDEPVTTEPQPTPAQNWRYAQPPPSEPSARNDKDDVRPQPSPLPPPRHEAEPKKSQANEEPAQRSAESKSDRGGYGSGDDMGRAKSGSAGAEAYRPSPRPPVQPERPGLGTSWGEQRHSQVSEAPFERASSSPTFSASLWYNDRQGAENMARYSSGYAAMDRATLYLARGVTVSLRDEYGSALPGFRANGKIFAIGDNNRRYTILIENRSNVRFEVVASVDGLDVIDGRDASYNKRGYIVDPYGRVEIEGFRQSEEAVAAFRFGSIRNSYAKQTTGSDRNVGVVGVAVFAERQHMPYWSSRDVERRQQADPFPSKWAQQPQPDPNYYYYAPQDLYHAR